MVPFDVPDPQEEPRGRCRHRAAGGTGRKAGWIPGIMVLAGCLVGLAGPWPVPPPSLPPPAGGPRAAPGRGEVVPADTGEVLAEARHRQRRFERFRRRRLPWTWGRGGPPCDERIGRYCLWMGDDEDSWEPPAEPIEVGRARRALLAHLDSALARAPRSGWLADQAVRYLVEAGRHHAALVAARTCRAERGRCRSLEGFVRHHMGQYEASETAFGEALAAMSDGAACRWWSLEPLYRDEPVPGYGEAACTARRPVEEWIWLLGDPLWLEPGNDRITEHFARRVRDRMQSAGAASPFGDPWGPDLREILLRYGWPTGFEQAHPGVYDATARRPAVAHYPARGMRYLPPAPGEPGREHERLARWELDTPRPRSEHAPSYLREEMEPLTHQTARFRRGDSLRLVAAWSPDPPGGRSGLFVASRLRGVRRAGKDAVGEPPRDRCGPGAADGVGAISVPVATAGPVVLGVETLSPSDSTAARARNALPPLRPSAATGPALSDLLLTAPSRDTVPADLGRARRCARSTERLEPGERLGLYWEVYPSSAGGQAAETRLAVTPVGGGVLRAIGEFLGLAGERRPVVSASWRERLPEAGVPHRRSLVVRIPPDAREGNYELGLTVRTGPDGRELQTSRRLEVRPP